MRRTSSSLAVISSSIIAASCTTVVSAPGSSQVRLTRAPAEVAGCTPVGYVQPFPQRSISSAKLMFRNRVIALGGNTGLITRYIFSDPIEGIAYRCPTGRRTAVR